MPQALMIRGHASVCVAAARQRPRWIGSRRRFLLAHGIASLTFVLRAVLTQNVSRSAAEQEVQTSHGVGYIELVIALPVDDRQTQRRHGRPVVLGHTIGEGTTSEQEVELGDRVGDVEPSVLVRITRELRDACGIGSDCVKWLAHLGLEE